MGRAPCCEKNGLKKGPWTPEEDDKLVAYIKEHGQGNWCTLPKNAGLSRCGKSCRLRWTNYLRPDIKRGRFSFEEEEAIIQIHSILGNKWSAIAARLPGRTDNEIKNYWNTHIRKRLLRMGIDPVTHAPRLDLLDLSSLLLKTSSPAAAASYYPTQADLDTLRALEPLAGYPDLLRLAASTLLTPTATSAAGEQAQLLLPWLLQAQMAQPQAAATMPPPATEQFLQACQMPGLVHASPTQQVAQQQQPQDHVAAAACVQHASYDDVSNHQPEYVPAMMQMALTTEASNLQQWSSTVTGSNNYNNNNNNNVNSGMSTPSSSPAATGRMNSSSTTTTTTCGWNASGDVVVDDAELLNMHLSELLDVSDYM